MKRYMLKRILFSIFSLVVVVMLVMLLVYTAIERSVIFQTDDVWNKKSNNDRTIYEYTMYRKYGYLDYVDYTGFLRTKYMAIYGDGYANEKFTHTAVAATVSAGNAEALGLIDCLGAADVLGITP